MDLAHLATTRHTCKAFDPQRKISADAIAQLWSLLRYAPSAVNAQPWHYFVADNDASKTRLARSASEGAYAGNGPKILQASHVIVCAARTDIDDTYLAALLAQEERDGRFPTDEAKAMQHKGRSHFVALHRDTLQDMPCWLAKQVYIALGMLLWGAATLGIDATPIEGFDHAALDAELGLQAQGLRSTVLVALGYRSADDFNAALPKSRFPAESVITTI